VAAVCAVVNGVVTIVVIEERSEIGSAEGIVANVLEMLGHADNRRVVAE
jgi:hypothetical protein